MDSSTRKPEGAGPRRLTMSINEGDYNEYVTA